MTAKAKGLIGNLLKLALLIGIMGSTSAYLFDSDEKSGMHPGEGKSIKYVPNKPYDEECTSCHVGYLPGFLPERSWVKLMDGLEDHFGENASLDDEVREEIKKFLIENSADKFDASPRSQRIAKMIPQEESPLRITETAFWIRKHFAVKDWVWKRDKIKSKARCDACHGDASKGVFSEYDVKVPKES